MTINKVGVVGLGLMGSGIAQVSAAAGCEVIGREMNDELIAGGKGKIESSLAKFAEKGKITTEQRDATLRRLSFTTSLSGLADCDLVIEAIVENKDAKTALFRELDGIVKKGCIFASNTSTIPINQIATVTNRKADFCGLHFFNPVPLMPLLEVISTKETSSATRDAATEWGKRVGKVPINAPDEPGFVVNRLLIPYKLEAVRMLERGDASIVDIDIGMQLGCNYPMGPFVLSDFVGIDTMYYAAKVLFEETGDELCRPPELLKKMVENGELGNKSGKGFYAGHPERQAELKERLGRFAKR
ncbi:MAG: 3-hydroxyacyl-CoA dehydrogenase family protein [Planctomycetes bacterium]|nr:3-hydroxyacyl-CoA dehydrogenase family protein [Planctomycetota bacterium]